MKNPFKKDSGVSPACAYCKNGRLSPDGEGVLCSKKGIVEKDFCCKKYKYDILKRQPKRPKKKKKFSPDEFKL